MDIQNPTWCSLARDEFTCLIDGHVVRAKATVGLAIYDTIINDGIPIAEPALTGNDVDAERDRRLQAFAYAGKAYDFDAGSRENISGAGTLALAAIFGLSVQPGDLRWADPDTDFVWITADNTKTPMDAQTCLEFAQAAAAWKAKHIYAARALKDQSPIPADFKDDRHWP